MSAEPGANVATRRPTETGALVAGATAFLLGRIFGWDGDVQGAVTVLIGALPAGITWVTEMRHR